MFAFSQTSQFFQICRLNQAVEIGLSGVAAGRETSITIALTIE
jgi:hypothetical protein